MECNEFKEKIDLFIDDMLDDAEKQRLIWHASSCTACKKAMDEAVHLKHALSNIGEVTPPAGLAASAIKKARRRHIPIYACASVAAAAVIALLVVFAPLLTPQSDSTNMVATEEKAYDMQQSSTEAQPKEAGFADDSAVAGNWDTENAESAAGVPESMEAASDGMVALCAPGEIYSSEAELVGALRDEAEKTRGSAYYYYRPAELPKGAQLIQIEKSDVSLRWVYSFGENSSETLVYEWYISRTPEDIQRWSEEASLCSDTLAHSFRYGGDYLWSAQARFNESGEMEATDGTVVNVYWAQNGGALHAQLPLTISDVFMYCVMEQVAYE